MEWWYPVTYYYEVATITSLPSNRTSVYTLEPAPTPFNVTDALLEPIWLETTTFDDYFNMSMPGYVYTTVPTPVAASTSVISISAVLPGPNGTFGALSDIDYVWTEAPEATVAVTGPSGTVFVA